MYEEISFNREELYELIWNEPITKLAQRYSLSDVGLAKICKKLKVPLPGRGYWQKGQTKRPPLPILKAGDLTSYILRREKKDILPVDEIQATQAAELIEQEKLPKNIIQVSTKLASPHPLVVKTQLSLEQASPDNYGRISPWSEKKSFRVSISPKSINRAMRILDALLKGFDIRGFAISFNEEERITYVSVLGQRIEIAMEEPSNKLERKLTSAEQKDYQKNPWRYYQKYSYVTTGELSLKIRSASWLNMRRSWSDGKKVRLEDILNDFMIGLIRTSCELRSWQLKGQIEKEERLRQQQEYAEKERKLREEKERFQTLLRDVEHWNMSKQIREYIEAVRMGALKKDGTIMPGCDLDNWLSWAEEQADKLDPLIEPRQSIH